MAVVLETSPLWPIIEEVTKTGYNNSYSSVKGILHTTLKDIEIPKMLAIDVKRDYSKAIGDEMFITFITGLGDYIYDIFPYRNNLEFSLKYIYLNTLDRSVSDEDIKVKRYKAVFLSNNNSRMELNEVRNLDKFTLNTKGIENVTLQLIDKSTEAIRIVTCGGVFEDMTNEQLNNAVLSTMSSNILIDGRPALDAIDIVPADNKDKRATTVIPQGTKIIDLPSFLQTKEGGLYNAGIGNYLQNYRDKMTWFIFPLYANERFNNTTKDKLMIYHVPSSRMDYIETTYMYKNQIVTVLGTSNSEINDDGEASMMDKGAGYSVANAEHYMKKPVEVDEEGPIGRGRKTTTQVISKDREDNVSMITMGSSRITTNQFAEATEILARAGSTMLVTWRNCNVELLYPGMPVKFIYMSGGTGVKEDEMPFDFSGILSGVSNTGTYTKDTVEPERQEVCGTLLFVQLTTQIGERGFSSNYYRSTAVLGIFIDRVNDKAPGRLTNSNSSNTTTTSSNLDGLSNISSTNRVNSIISDYTNTSNQGSSMVQQEVTFSEKINGLTNASNCSVYSNQTSIDTITNLNGLSGTSRVSLTDVNKYTNTIPVNNNRPLYETYVSNAGYTAGSKVKSAREVIEDAKNAYK